MQDFSLNRRFWNAVLAKAQANLYIDASRTYLTVAWWALEPLLLMALYWVVFGAMLNMQQANFAAFLIVGLIPWLWLERSVAGSTNSILDGALVLHKVPINRLYFPLAILMSDLAKNTLVFGLLVAIMLVIGDGEPVRWAALLAVFLIQVLLVAALCFWAALLTPFFPDLHVLVGLGLRVLMFASGIFYPVSVLPESYQTWFFWNPIALVLDEYRNALLRNQPPDWDGLLVVALGCTLMLAAAVLFSHRYGDRYLKRVF